MESTEPLPTRRDVVAVDAAVEIGAPAAQAWAVLADYARDVEWRDGVRSMVPTPPGPVTTGTTTAETMRAAGRTLHNGGEVTAVQEGRRFTWRTTSGVPAEGSRQVTPLGADRCRVDLALRVEPPGVLGSVPWLVRAMLRRGLDADVRRLRGLVEVATTPPGGR